MFIEVTYANRDSSEGQPYKILINLDKVIQVSPYSISRPSAGSTFRVTEKDSYHKKIDVTETYDEIKRKIMKIKRIKKEKKNRFELMDL